MNKTVLIQTASQKCKDLFPLIRSRHNKYCDRWKIDYRASSTTLQSARSEYWDKIVLILKTLQAGYREIIYLESVSVILDMNTNLRRVFETAGDILAVEEEKVNCDVLFIRNTDRVKRFFEIVWGIGNNFSFKNDKEFIDSYIDSLRQKEEWLGILTPINSEWNFISNEVPEAKIVNWNHLDLEKQKTLSLLKVK